jgi:hypothetical protein
VRHHPPAGWRIQGENSASSTTRPLQGFYFVPKAGWASRYLSVELLGLLRQRQTIIRLDAQKVWFYPRSPTEKVPVQAQEVDIRAQKLGPTGSRGPISADYGRPVVTVHRRITDPAQVATIVRWFDALPVDQGIRTSCGPSGDLETDFVFRSSRGARLASAGFPAVYPANACVGAGFSILGQSQPSLVDLPNGPSFVCRVGKLFGVTLTSPRYC